jgi:hypothetical protein
MIPACSARYRRALPDRRRGFRRRVLLQSVQGELQGRVARVSKRKQVRWYNPALEDFEWREVPDSDKDALSLLEDSSHAPTCIDIYRQWRELGASVTVALIRAGEVAKEEYDQSATP